MFNNFKLVPATGKVDDQFVGLRIFNNEIEFHYPQTYHITFDDDKELRKEIVSILRTVSLAKTLSTDKSSYNSKHKNQYIFPIKSFLWIINDYLTYGRYENRELVYEHGIKGKVNWKKTMRSNPAISCGNIIYTDIISERKNHKDNLLTEIYFFCVQKAIDSIGWLYNIKFSSDGKDYYKLFNKKKYINVINDELSHSFDDLKKIRLNNMKNIIQGLDESMINSKDIIFGVDSYDYVYEKMIDSMFSKLSGEDKKKFNPNAKWSLLYPIRKDVDSTNLRPDTILKNGEDLYILDAKYYRYGVTFKPSDLPETTSIQKQITYGEYVKQAKEGKFKNIYSAFIMPYDKYDNINSDKLHENMEFIGIASAEWFDKDDKEKNRKIAGLLVDTKFLIDNWAKNSDSNISNLVDLINKNIGGLYE